jgi:hypothetical protein
VLPLPQELGDGSIPFDDSISKTGSLRNTVLGYETGKRRKRKNSHLFCTSELNLNMYLLLKPLEWSTV